MKQTKYVWVYAGRLHSGRRVWSLESGGRSASIHETGDRCTFTGDPLFELDYSPDGRSWRFGGRAPAPVAFSDGVDRVRRGW